MLLWHSFYSIKYRQGLESFCSIKTKFVIRKRRKVKARDCREVIPRLFYSIFSLQGIFTAKRLPPT